MKTQKRLLPVAIMLIGIAMATIANAQSPNRVAKFVTALTFTNSSIFDNGTSIGINTVSPASLFHINGIGANTGNVFRTDGTSTADNMWQLFTGTTVASATEKFRLYVPSGTGDAVLQTLRPGGKFLFKAGGNITHLLIADGTPINNTTIGYIAMGNNLPNSFNPSARLHLHESNGNAGSGAPFIRFTNQNSGFGTTDGYAIGIDGNGKANLINWEPQPINIFTNNGGNTVAQRMTIFTNCSFYS